jgi:hypothetical protein
MPVSDAVRERRVKHFTLASEMLLPALQGQLRVTPETLPPDAEFVRASYDVVNDVFLIVVAHPRFERVPILTDIPAYFPLFVRSA